MVFDLSHDILQDLVIVLSSDQHIVAGSSLYKLWIEYIEFHKIICLSQLSTLVKVN